MIRSCIKYLKSNSWKWLFWFFLAIGLVCIHHYSNFDRYFTEFLLWVDRLGIWGAIAFIVIYVVTTMLCVPGSILALGGGAVFGAFWGAILVFVGGFLGAVGAFCLGRYFLKNWAKRKLLKNRYLQAIDRALADEGWKFAFLLHLSPIIPFNILNYVLGASKLAGKDFVMATAIGIVPGVILYTFIGSTFGDLTAIVMEMSNPSHSKTQWLFSVAGSIATIILVVYLGRIAQRKLQGKLD